MNKVYAKLKALAASPQFHALEVWALRAGYAYLAVKLGIGVDHAVQK